MRQHVPKFVVLGLVASTAVLLHAPGAYAADTNLMANPSVETALAGNANAPASWTFSSWGTNTVSSAWSTGGKGGARSLTVTMTKRSSGDAKWMGQPVAVTPNTRYQVSNWYVANVRTSLEVLFTSTTGAVTYGWLADLAASSAWKQGTATVTTPANCATATFFHVIERVGKLQTDLYSVTATGVAPSASASSASSSPSASSASPSPSRSSASPSASPSASSASPSPSRSPSSSAPSSSAPSSAASSSSAATVPTVNLTAPVAGATLVGTQNVTATASDPTGLVGVQFTVDSVAVGGEDTVAPYSIAWDSTTVANGPHTVGAIARNAANRSTTASVQIVVSNVATPVGGGSNLVTNPSMETQETATKPVGWASDSWGTNNAAFSYPATGHTGGRSVRVDVSTYTSGDAKWHFANVPVTPGKSYQFTGWYQSSVDTEIDLEITRTDNTVEYAYLTSVPASTGWAKVSGQYTMPVGAKSATAFHAIAAKGYLVVDDISFAEYVPTGFSRGLVSLTFDDGWKSQYSDGKRLLDLYGLKGTFYLLSGTTSYPDYMSVADMQNLAAAGHEVGSHTVNHLDLTTLSVAALTTELTASQTSLKGWTGQTVRNIATPYGAYNSTVVNEIAKYYRSHRTVDEGYNSKDNFDIKHIKVQNILNTTTPEQVGVWVDQALRDHTWLVLVYHEVATNVADPTYAVTPGDLSTELNMIKSKGATVKTLDQALDEIQPQL